MTRSATVCAVIYGPALGPSWLTLASAVAEQSCAPAVILTTVEGLEPMTAAAPPTTSVAAFTSPAGQSPFTAAVRAAASCGSAWLWLLDGAAVPAPDALQRLLSAIEGLSGPAPLLLSSKVLDPDGRLHPDAMPRHEIFEKERSVEAARQHVVQLRAAGPGSVLVASGAVQRFGTPRADLPLGLDMFEWSARLLRSWEDTGYLIPASVAVRSARPAAPPRRHWWARVRVLGSPAWTPTEKLWEAFLLAEAAAGAIRRGGVRDARRSAPPAPAHRVSRAE